MTDSPGQPTPSESSGAAREPERNENPRAAAGITYGAMLLAAVVFSVLIVVAIRSETAGSLSGAGLLDADDVVGLLRNGTGVYFVVALTVQLVSMALGGRMHLSVTAVDSRSDLLHLSIGFLPVMITVVGAVALFICSRVVAARQVRRQERVAPDQVWLSSLVTAGLLTVFAMVLTMVLAGRATEDGDYAVRLHFWAMSPGLVICPLVFGTLLGVWARRTALGPEPTRVSDLVHQWVPGLAPAARLSALYLGALSVLGLILLSIGSGVEEGSFAAFLAVLLIGTFAGVDLVSMTHLGAVTAVARGDGGNARETLFLWSGGTRDVATAWPMLMWLFLVVGILVLACAWAGRRPGLGRWTSWVAMPLVFFLAGLVTLMLGRISAEISVQAYSGYSARLSMGSAWWTPVVFALWGGVVEVLARYAVPHLARAVPQGRARRAVRSPGSGAVRPARRERRCRCRGRRFRSRRAGRRRERCRDRRSGRCPGGRPVRR